MAYQAFCWGGCTFDWNPVSGGKSEIWKYWEVVHCCGSDYPASVVWAIWAYSTDFSYEDSQGSDAEVISSG
jgi:hypothetical protein